jgi:hypothetical protein
MHCPPVVDASANIKQEASIYVYVSLSLSFFFCHKKANETLAVSQCQAIHARSVFPCQDTPDIKSTFDFNIKSPHPVIASGLPLREKGNTENNVYKFKQNVPIPSYLFALASGYVHTWIRSWKVAIANSNISIETLPRLPLALEALLLPVPTGLMTASGNSRQTLRSSWRQ